MTNETRKYSVKDVERMRRRLERNFEPDLSAMKPGTAWGEGPFNPGELEARDANRKLLVEAQLRTYIAAGISPDELEG